MHTDGLTIHNTACAPLADVPVLPFEEFREFVLMGTESGDRVAALFGAPGAGESVRLYAVLARDRMGVLAIAATDVAGAFPSLAPDCTQVHMFEREIAEQWNILPEGHPWLKPVRTRGRCRHRAVRDGVLPR